MVKQVKSNDELVQAMKGADKKLVVIDFFATWCGPCVAIAPFYQELSDKYKNAVFLKIDVDDQALEESIQKYNINCMPTFVFVKNDKEVDRLEGASKENLEKKVKEYSS